MNNLIEIRCEIDKIDKRMIGLIAKRAEFVKAAAKLKKSVKEVHAKNRVKAVMRTRRHWAASAGISPDLIEDIYKRLVGHFINEETRLIGGFREKRLRNKIIGAQKVMYYSKDKLKLRKDVMGATMWAVALESAMLSYFEVQPFSEFKEHSHESAQITCVLEGELYFETPDGTVKVRKGEVIAIPSNVVHTVTSKDKFVRAVDAWSPPPMTYKLYDNFQ